MLGGWPIRALRLEHDDRMVYPLGASFFTYVSIGASFGNLARFKQPRLLGKRLQRWHAETLRLQR